MSGEMLREAVDWVVTALAGRASPEEVATRLAPRLAARGDVAGYLAGNQRFAAFRDHPAVVEELRARGEWAARAALTTGPARWELDVAIEPEPPHRIVSFQPRPVAADAVVLGGELRAADHRWSSLDEATAARIDRRLAAVADEQSLVGMAVGIAVGGEVVYRGRFGVADLESRAPLRDDSVFRVGSVTKMVTALAVRRLAEAGAIDLDAPIEPAGRVVLEPAEPGGRLPTARELLVHTGGLPKDVRAARIRLAWAPGERAEYSNVGYGLLGGVVARAAGRPFAQFCAEEILDRYGLGHTTMQEPGVAAPADVTGYRVAGGRVAPAPPAVAPLPSAGGMTSTVDDLLRLTALFTRGDKPFTSGDKQFTGGDKPPPGFAPGVAILDDRLLWRGGATDGFTAEIVAALDGSCAVVVLASKSPPEGLREVARELCETTAGRVG